MSSLSKRICVAVTDIDDRQFKKSIFNCTTTKCQQVSPTNLPSYKAIKVPSTAVEPFWFLGPNSRQSANPFLAIRFGPLIVVGNKSGIWLFQFYYVVVLHSDTLGPKSIWFRILLFICLIWGFGTIFLAILVITKVPYGSSSSLHFDILGPDNI